MIRSVCFSETTIFDSKLRAWCLQGCLCQLETARWVCLQWAGISTCIRPQYSLQNCVQPGPCFKRLSVFSTLRLNPHTGWEFTTGFCWLRKWTSKRIHFQSGPTHGRWSAVRDCEMCGCNSSRFLQTHAITPNEVIADRWYFVCKFNACGIAQTSQHCE